MKRNRDIELLYEVGCLRFIQRTWRQFLNADFANVAEHTLRVLWISLLLAKYEKVKNIEKIMKMALVHDLSESRTGDVNTVIRQFTQRDEVKAISETLKETSVDELTNLWKEFEEGTSPESRIVQDADMIDPDFELQEQISKGNNGLQAWKTRRKNIIGKKLRTKSGKKLWKMIIHSHPHDWHLHASNRFTTGDWKK